MKPLSQWLFAAMVLSMGIAGTALAEERAEAKNAYVGIAAGASKALLLVEITVQRVLTFSSR